MTDGWQKDVTQEDTLDMVDEVSVAGFSGIYVNTDGYADLGGAITSNLSSILRTKPLVSDDGRLFFFDMSVYNSERLNRSANRTIL
jgi:phosphoglycerol transferase